MDNRFIISRGIKVLQLISSIDLNRDPISVHSISYSTCSRKGDKNHLMFDKRYCSTGEHKAINDRYCFKCTKLNTSRRSMRQTAKVVGLTRLPARCMTCNNLVYINSVKVNLTFERISQELTLNKTNKTQFFNIIDNLLIYFAVENGYYDIGFSDNIINSEVINQSTNYIIEIMEEKEPDIPWRLI